jgi:capsular exopolysaccharide synthesis family protein
MIYGGEWEDDLLNGREIPPLYSQKYLNEGPSEEGLSQDNNSYVEQFLDEDDWRQESEGRNSKRGSDLNRRRAEYERERAEKEIDTRGSQGRNQLRDPDVIRKIIDIRNSFQRGNLPRLSRRSEKLLNRNFNQLSVAEGNLLSQKKEIKTIYVTSSFPKEGKTISAVSLAYALSVYGGHDVLLVDSNFASPQIHRLFNINNTIGLRDIFDQGGDPLHVIIPTLYESLSLVVSGSQSSSQLSAVEGKDFKEILDRYSAGFEYIIFDGSAVFSSTDPVFFARYFDSMIVVVECERTKWDVAQITIEKIIRANGNVTGVVLNKRKFYIPKVLYDKI